MCSAIWPQGMGDMSSLTRDRTHHTVLHWKAKPQPLDGRDGPGLVFK